LGRWSSTSSFLSKRSDCPTSSLSRERLDAGERAVEDNKGMDVAGTFMSVDGFEVHGVTHQVMFHLDTVPPCISRATVLFAGDIAGIGAAICLRRRDADEPELSRLVEGVAIDLLAQIGPGGTNLSCA
jgi:hypothetical protein